LTTNTVSLGGFPNAEACSRLVTALCVEQSEGWISGRRYLEMNELPVPLWDAVLADAGV
jgi:transposase-like protein